MSNNMSNGTYDQFRGLSAGSKKKVPDIQIGAKSRAVCTSPHLQDQGSPYMDIKETRTGRFRYLHIGALTGLSMTGTENSIHRHVSMSIFGPILVTSSVLCVRACVSDDVM